MFLAKLEINKGRPGYGIAEEQEKAVLIAFDNKGKPFFKEGIEHFEERFSILTSFNYHGDTYFFITEKIDGGQQND